MIPGDPSTLRPFPSWRMRMFLLAAALAVLPALLLIGPARSDTPGETPRPGPLAQARLRQPVALGLHRDGTRLWVANRRSGSISLVDPATMTVTAEHGVAEALADLAVLSEGRHLLAVDPAAGSVLLLEDRQDNLAVLGRQPVDPGPAMLLAAPDGHWCVVAALWPRSLTFLALEGAGEATAPRFGSARRLALPFSPRNMVLAGSGVDSRLIVADAFGGRLAVVDPRKAVIETIRALPAHGIRGLAISPDGRKLIVAHQVLHRLGRTTFEDVHWGSLLTNTLRILELDQVRGGGSDADVLRRSRLVEVGETGNGSGDPGAMAQTPSGDLLLVLSGVDELRIGREPGALTTRTGVGRQPAAIALRPDGLTAYVANRLDDTLSVVDVATGLYRGTIALGVRPELTAADRGERLFTDARLSHDGWMSCQSCHTDGHTCGRSGDTLGDGGFGAPKRVPSLLGVAATGPWGWLGSFARLEDQVAQSIASTMQGPRPSEAMVSDLTAYLQSLAPPPPGAHRSSGGDPERGRTLFQVQRCADCHSPPEFTTARTYDVGLVDEVGHCRFNPPSLRGVGCREPLLHDGRAATLEEVFRVHPHPRQSTLSPEEAADLAAYVQTL